MRTDRSPAAQATRKGWPYYNTIPPPRCSRDERTPCIVGPPLAGGLRCAVIGLRRGVIGLRYTVACAAR